MPPAKTSPDSAYLSLQSAPPAPRRLRKSVSESHPHGPRGIQNRRLCHPQGKLLRSPQGLRDKACIPQPSIPGPGEEEEDSVRTKGQILKGE